MPELKSLSEITKVTVGSPERAAAVDAANKAAAAEALLMQEDDDIEVSQDEPREESFAFIDNTREENFRSSRESLDTEEREFRRREDDNTESIVIKNNRTPVSITVPAGKNAMTGAPSKLVISFEAHEVQVSEDFISVLYKHSFTLLPPAFTPVTLTVAGVTYNVMSMNASRKLGPLTDINFVIVRSPNGEESGS